MKIRILPLTLTVVLTATVLFGGWFTYRNVAVQQPLQQMVTEVQGVKSAVPAIERDAVTIKLELENGAAIREIYDTIMSNSADYIGGRELKIELEQTSNQQLDELWSSVLFVVAQAMETRQYAAIPAAMQQLEKAHPGLHIATEMDQKNVYITMVNDQASKYIILPRMPAELGVWSHA